MAKEKQIEWTKLELINTDKFEYRGKVKVSEKIFSQILKLTGRLEASARENPGINTLINNGIHVTCPKKRIEFILIGSTVFKLSGKSVTACEDPGGVVKEYLIKVTADKMTDFPDFPAQGPGSKNK